MRHWGVVISAFYLLILAGLLLPFAFLLGRFGEPGFEWSELNYLAAFEWDVAWWGWILPWGALLIAGQAMLLCLSVDTSWRRLEPRQKVRRTALVSGLLVALLVTAAVASVMAAAIGDGGNDFFVPLGWLGVLVAVWLVWAVVFTLHYRAGFESLDRVVRWLLHGSVLELLVAVPSHVIVRQRDDCCAPAFTSWGIVTGLAVMLACFGPGVLALYRKRIESYGAETRETPPSAK